MHDAHLSFKKEPMGIQSRVWPVWSTHALGEHNFLTFEIGGFTAVSQKIYTEWYIFEVQSRASHFVVVTSPPNTPHTPVIAEA
jgi:hypothetical protein